MLPTTILKAAARAAVVTVVIVAHAPAASAFTPAQTVPSGRTSVTVVATRPASPSEQKEQRSPPASNDSKLAFPARLRAETAATKRQEEEPRRTIRWDDGLWIESPGGFFTSKIGGVAQLDSAAFVAYPSLEEIIGPVENGVQWRRARLHARGTIGSRWSYFFRWDFAVNDPPNLKDAWMEFEFLRAPIKIRAGRFSSTFGLENQGSSNDTVFMEAGLPAEFVPPQETGILVHSEGLAGGRWDISFAGASDNPLDCIICDVTGLAARYGRAIELGGPERFVHVGGDYSRRFVRDDLARLSARPESNLSPALVDTGFVPADRTDTLMVEGALVSGPVSVQSEYAFKRLRVPDDANPVFHAFYVMATYSITGEERGYDRTRGRFIRITPRREFRGGSRGRGAFEIAGRFSRMDLDDQGIRGGILNDVGLALNWYPTRLTRVMGNVIMAKREGAAAMWIFQMRLQLAL